MAPTTASHRFPSACAASSAAYLRCFALIRRACKRSSAGLGSQLRVGAKQPFGLRSGDVDEANVRNGVVERLEIGREPVEQSKVPTAAERLEHHHAILAALPFELRKDRLTARNIGVQTRDGLPEMLEQHVQVARGAERTAEPPQLFAERLEMTPGERAGCTDERTRSPGCYAEAMKILGVVSETDAGVEGLELPELAAEQKAQVLDRRRGSWRSLLVVERENAHELRSPFRHLSPSATQHARQTVEIVFVPFDQLDFDLLECLLGAGLRGARRPSRAGRPRANALPRSPECRPGASPAPPPARAAHTAGAPRATPRSPPARLPPRRPPRARRAQRRAEASAASAEPRPRHGSGA